MLLYSKYLLKGLNISFEAVSYLSMSDQNLNLYGSNTKISNENLFGLIFLLSKLEASKNWKIFLQKNPENSHLLNSY